MSKIKKFLFLFFGLILILAVNKDVLAAEPDLLFGETHNYSVVLRGNGESIVYARINLTNNQDSTLNNYSFEVPGLNVEEIVGYKVELSQYCTQYDYSQTTIDYGAERPCLRYQEPDYSSGYYSDTNTEYHKLNFTNEGNKYNIELPKPIDPDKSTAFVLSYTGKGYIDETFGLYKFNFETLKVAERIKSVNVAVDVDSDFILEGQRAKVNYDTGSGTSEFASGASLDKSNKAALGRTIQQIGASGTITKDAQNLAAGESFSVKGKFAASAWRLNLSKIVISLAVILIIIAGLLWLSKRLKKNKVPGQTGSVSSAVQVQAQTQKQDNSSNNLVNPLFIGVGFASSAVTVAGTYLISIFIKANDNAGYSDPDPLSGIIVFIVGLLFFLLVIFGPAIWFAANRKNWRALIYILFWVFAWLIVFAALYQWGLKDLFYSQPEEPEYYPILRDCINC